MKWVLSKSEKFVGIDVYMHLTFLLLIGWVALVHWQRGQNVGTALVGVLFILAIFLCVVLHEFGHALMARRYGIATRDIILLPIGGVARLEKIPSQPMQELWGGPGRTCRQRGHCRCLVRLAAGNGFVGTLAAPDGHHRPAFGASHGGQSVHDRLQHDSGLSHGWGARLAGRPGNAVGITAGRPGLPLLLAGRSPFCLA